MKLSSKSGLNNNNFSNKFHNKILYLIQILYMGNKVCCSETRTHGYLEKQEIQISERAIIEDSKNYEKLENTDLLPKVIETLNLKNFFHNQVSKQTNPINRRYGKDIYLGSLDSDGSKPNGFGKMYKADRSLYIGFFNHGKAEGKGAFIFADGSYYEGDFLNNTADSLHGHYHSQTLGYKGGFKKNNFEGQGVQIGRDYIFEGQFHNGFRAKGTLKWQNETYTYTGGFNNHNRFQGKGKLKQPHGIYEGDFLDGLKHGKGVYHFKNNSRYEGDYFHGQRQGYGIIYHGDNTIAYVGQFKKGLPDGKGSMMQKGTGKLIETFWVLGIDAAVLPQSH